MKKIKVNSDIYVGEDKLATVKEISDKYEPIINLKTLGAIGDGETNDSIALQELLNGLSKTKLCNNVYTSYAINGVRVPSNANIDGSMSTCFKIHKDSQTYTEALLLRNVKDIVIENVIFDGNKELVPGDIFQHVFLLVIDKCENITLRNCTFKNSMGPGVDVRNSKHIKIEKCNFLDIDSAINTHKNLTDGTIIEDITISDCLFDGLGYKYSEPITLENVTTGLINNCVITNKLDTAGIWCIKSSNIKIDGNTISNTESGIKVHGCKDIKITDNTLYDIIENAFDINGDRINIRLNTVDRVKRHVCIGSYTDENVTDNGIIEIEDNKFYNFCYNGSWYNSVLIDKESEVYIEHNKFIQNDSTAISKSYNSVVKIGNPEIKLVYKNNISVTGKSNIPDIQTDGTNTSTSVLWENNEGLQNGYWFSPSDESLRTLITIKKYAIE